MKPTSHAFSDNARRALNDATLQQALAKAGVGFVDKRRATLSELPEFDALREAGRAIKDHTLANLDHYLLRFEEQVAASGGQVRWAETPERACAAVLDICRKAGARIVAKGKSMVGEEIAVNDALEAAGLDVVETDLGEYIIQVAHEPPSHIIAPAVHKTRAQIARLFEDLHHQPGLTRPLETVPQIVDEARQVLREKFLAADVGITGANFIIAETGSTVIVTNEGNGDLSATLPRVHIVLASIEKVVPNLEDASVLLRLLARSATGQEITSYTTFFTGPRRGNDADGPEQFHVVLVDNGRSRMLGGAYHEMLRCIRCGACLNHCPVYSAVGGHAYGWVYPGPMGAVLTPLMVGLDEGRPLPNASTLCGRCEEVCPMSIPLPTLLREHRSPGIFARIAAATQPLGAGCLGLLCAAAAALPLGNAPGHQAAQPIERRPWPLPQPALCAGLDRRARPAGAAGRHLHGPAAAEEAAMSDSRAAILGRISQALGHAARADAPDVMQRVSGHARGPQPQWAEADRERFLAKLVKVAGTHAGITSRRRICRSACASRRIHCWPISCGRKAGRWNRAAPGATTGSASQWPSAASPRPAVSCCCRGPKARPA